MHFSSSWYIKIYTLNQPTFRFGLLCTFLGVKISYKGRGLKGVFAKNERGYKLNAIKKRFWSLLILLLSVASKRRKANKTLKYRRLNQSYFKSFSGLYSLILCGIHVPSNLEKSKDKLIGLYALFLKCAIKNLWWLI